MQNLTKPLEIENIFSTVVRLCWVRIHLELCVNPIKSRRIIWQLLSYILGAHEDAFKMRPGPLYFEPHCNDLVGY